jgi:hypothetical protein
MYRTLRSTAVALIVLSLLASSAYALPLAGSRSAGPEGIAANLWTWISSLFGQDSAPALGKAGSHMDPDGRYSSDTLDSTTTADAGSHMDPDGHQ